MATLSHPDRSRSLALLLRASFPWAVLLAVAVLIAWLSGQGIPADRILDAIEHVLVAWAGR